MSVNNTEIDGSIIFSILDTLDDEETNEFFDYILEFLNIKLKKLVTTSISISNSQIEEWFEEIYQKKNQYYKDQQFSDERIQTEDWNLYLIRKEIANLPKYL